MKKFILFFLLYAPSALQPVHRLQNARARQNGISLLREPAL